VLARWMECANVGKLWAQESKWEAEVGVGTHELQMWSCHAHSVQPDGGAE
jgi:hypothetical protein